MITLAGLDEAEMQSKASKRLFSQSVAQLASFDGVQAPDVRVVSAVNTGRGVRVQAAITAKNSDAAQQVRAHFVNMRLHDTSRVRTV